MTRDELIAHIKEELCKVLPDTQDELSGTDFDQAETVLQELVDNGIEALDAAEEDEDEEAPTAGTDEPKKD